MAQSLYVGARQDERHAPVHRRVSDPVSSRSKESFHDSRRVLWIDDQVTADDPLVLALRGIGIEVECAPTGADAIRLARSACFDGLVLDLNLPDAPGLVVLQTLRTEGVSTPVLVLTGFGDTESALSAGRLGVICFKHKPVMLDEFVDCIRGLIDNDAQSVWTRAPYNCHGGRKTPLAVSEGLVGLDLLASFARALADPTLDVIAFVACAEVLHQALLRPSLHSSVSLAEEANSAIERLSIRLCYAKSTHSFEALRTISEALARGCRPSAAAVARELCITPDALDRQLESDTSRPFAAWRSAHAIMLAVRQLATSIEHISQIAYALGFNHVSQFDREFHRLFGVSPRAFRALLNHLNKHARD